VSPMLLQDNGDDTVVWTRRENLFSSVVVAGADYRTVLMEAK
jgi:hypothetical protein